MPSSFLCRLIYQKMSDQSINRPHYLQAWTFFCRFFRLEELSVSLSLCTFLLLVLGKINFQGTTDKMTKGGFLLQCAVFILICSHEKVKIFTFFFPAVFLHSCASIFLMPSWFALVTSSSSSSSSTQTHNTLNKMYFVNIYSESVCEITDD